MSVGEKERVLYAMGISAVFGIEKIFPIFSEHIEVVCFACDIEKKNDIENIEYRMQH